ncbi:MAG: FtsX-like permease family protein [Bacteroidetes bacterium]|jgi:cell division transport system permease protein|nr:FtsX-like permease family protein [Bacteroidota bacterium]
MSALYLLKEGVAGLSRARLAALTSIFSLFLAVLLIGVITRIGFNAYEISQLLRQQVEVEVFLEGDDPQTTARIQNRIDNEPFVEELIYISQDSASKIFQEEFGMGGRAIANLNFLPASFRLKMSDQVTIAQIDSLVQEIDRYEGVSDVQFNLALLEMLEARTDQITVAGGLVGGFILLIAMILVFNTIRLTIYAKRDLIRAMKLVGATNRFIRTPFLIEGILQGLIAGVAASALIWALFEWIAPYYFSQLGVLNWPFGKWYYLIGGVVLLAMVMGWWGSRLAARKFIKDSTVYS